MTLNLCCNFRCYAIKSGGIHNVGSALDLSFLQQVISLCVTGCGLKWNDTIIGA